MNINDLTLGQLKEIQSLSILNNTSEVKQSDNSTQYDILIGKFVLVRHNKYGVNCGTLVNPSKEGFYLANGRKFWRWQADKGVSLESFSKSVRAEGTRASHIQELVYIPSEELCGIILVSDSEKEKMLSLAISDQD